MAGENAANWGQVAAAAIQTGGQIAVNAARNKKQWKYQQLAMDKQQQMNKEVWDYQNAYNTPQSQMQRLQDAGLNPRLIYGEGSSAPNTAGPLQAPEAPVRQATGGDINLMNYYQIRQADAQYKQTTMATQLMQKRGALIDLQEGLKNLELFRENMRSKNYPQLVSAELDMEKFLALRAGELYANEKTKGNLMDQLGEMRKKQMSSIDLDNAFKKNRNALADLGIYQSDHPAFRILIQAAQRMNIDLGELLSEGAEKLKYLLDLSK